MFTIFEISWFFKCTWVCSSSSSKNKNIFSNLSTNSINLKMSIYLSISKMSSSLFSQGNQGTHIANAKRTTQSRDAALSANLYLRNALDLWTGVLTLATSSLLWKQQWNSWHLLRNNEHIFLILWILPSGFGWNWCQNWRFILSTMCANDRNFHVSTRPLRPFLVLFVTTFEQKHCFSTSSFWGSNFHFLDDLDYLLCNVGVSFWFYPIQTHFF